MRVDRTKELWLGVGNIEAPRLWLLLRWLTKSSTNYALLTETDPPGRFESITTRERIAFINKQNGVCRPKDERCGYSSLRHVSWQTDANYWVYQVTHLPIISKYVQVLLSTSCHLTLDSASLMYHPGDSDQNTLQIMCELACTPYDRSTKSLDRCLSVMS
jgi:hypothetical protein